MTVTRRVKKLRLRSHREDALRHGAVLLEDALRTASLPAADGSRLLIIRRLSLGAFPATASSMSVSLMVEERLRLLSASAVHAEDPQAPAAPAVFFHDDVEPAISLALKIARGHETSAWFWKPALPGWQPDSPARENLRWLLYQTLQTEPGSLAVIRMVKTLLRESALDPVLAALQPPDGLALLQSFGWSSPSPAAAPLIFAEAPARHIGLPAAGVLENFIALWGPADHRTGWLASLFMVLARPALRNSVTLSHKAASLIQQVMDSRSEASTLLESGDPSSAPAQSAQTRDTDGDGTMNRSAAETETKLLSFGPPGITFEPEDQPATPAASLSEDSHVSDRSDMTPEAELESEPEIEPEDIAGESISPTGCLSRRAGLFFLLAAMERTGLPQWMDEQRETVAPDFPAQLLRAIARRLDTDSNDPALPALGEDGLDAAGHEHALHLWISCLRAYCRRVAGIGLHSLVCRNGRIAATPTHLDVFFPASDADIRVRKAGLDLHPGWLPWFGKVVSFHYLSRGDYDA
jgi:hypothetical protein